MCNNIAEQCIRTNVIETKSGWSKQKICLELKLAMGRKGNRKCYRNVTWKRKERKGRSVDE